MSKNWQGGSTTAWRRTRAMVLERDGYQCQLQFSPKCEGRATHVHHTVARSLVGDDPRYLIASCAACNLAYGDPSKRADPPLTGGTSW